MDTVPEQSRARVRGVGRRLVQLFDPARFTRYVVAGGSATAFDFLALTLLVKLGHMDRFPWYVLAATFAFLAATILHFAISYSWVFVDRRNHRGVQFARFFAIAVAGILVNNAILVLLVERSGFALGIEPGHRVLLAKVIATGVVACATFMANNLWAFRRPSATA